MDKLFSTIMGNTSTDKSDVAATAAANKNAILKNQQMTQQKLTDLLNKSMDALSCGPSCQQERTADDLKQKYMSAQIKLKVAPIELEESKKNYYTFTEGEPYYDNMREEELKQKAAKITDSIGKNFNKQVDDAYGISNSLSISSINNKYIQELLDKLKQDNAKLLKIYNGTHRDTLTNDRKVEYETDALDKLKASYSFWLKIYYLIVLIYTIIILVKSSSTSIMLKIVYILLWVNYPYIVLFFIKFIYNIYGNVQALIPKNVYESL